MSAGFTPGRSTKKPRFYMWVAISFVLLVFAGFARTYYLKELFGTRALPLLLHVHGLVMTSWFVLFFVQVRLVAVHRTDLHRRLGIFGAVLSLLVVTIDSAVILTVTKRNFMLGRSLAGMAFQLSIVLVFTVLIATALLLRRRRDWHKRLIVLGCAVLLSPAIARLPLAFLRGNGLAFFGLSDLCVIAPLVFDTVRNRRLHPAFGWGALLIIALQPLSFLFGATHSWTRFAAWLVS